MGISTKHFVLPFSLGAALACSAWSGAAQAQETTTTTTTTTAASGPTVVHEREVSHRGTYRAPLLGTGIVVFGLSYGTAAIVGAESDHQGDHHLFVPVAGPWIDIANRGDCPVGSNACDNETANKILLGIDGVLQAVGAIEIVAALLSPDDAVDTTAKAAPPEPTIHLTPARIGSGYGLGAALTF